MLLAMLLLLLLLLLVGLAMLLKEEDWSENELFASSGSAPRHDESIGEYV